MVMVMMMIFWDPGLRRGVEITFCPGPFSSSERWWEGGPGRVRDCIFLRVLDIQWVARMR